MPITRQHLPLCDYINERYGQLSSDEILYVLDDRNYPEIDHFEKLMEFIKCGTKTVSILSLRKGSGVKIGGWLCLRS